MLTLKDLEQMPKETIFATGLALDNEDGLFMANTGKELKWIAVSGCNTDWAIYCFFSYKDIEWIEANGDKVQQSRNIRKCVPCDDGALGAYRH